MKIGFSRKLYLQRGRRRCPETGIDTETTKEVSGQPFSLIDKNFEYETYNTRNVDLLGCPDYCPFISRNSTSISYSVNE